MWELKSLIRHSSEAQANIHGRWVPARPYKAGGLYGFCSRCKDAWQVLIGKYDSFKWPEGQ